MITLNNMMELMSNSDRVRVFRGDEELYTGYLAYINGVFHGENLGSIGLTGEEPVKKYRVVPEIRHKDWKKLGLMEPLQPEEMESYRFADLIMSLYHVIMI